MKLSLLSSVVLLARFVSGVYGISRNLLRPPPFKTDGLTLDTGVSLLGGAIKNGSTTFQQYIDHAHPELGAFSQRYWWNSEYWAGPGSPVVLFTPGEDDASYYTAYLTKRAITGLFAEAIGGAVVLLEHRYFGQSSPYEDQTSENLQQLTVENAIADLTHFANTVKLPFDPNNTSQASKAPWVLSGGSYAGALSAWTESTAPGTFWAYHASSAPVEAIYDFWQYFVAVQEGMARNCSADVTLVIDHIDKFLSSGNDIAKQALKKRLGLGGLKHDDSALMEGPFLWQDNNFYSGYSPFYEFCDYVENVANKPNPVLPSANGVGLKKALAGYARWMKEAFIPGYCASFGYWTDPNSISCFDTYNASSPIYTDLSAGNTFGRTWEWLLCNQPLGYWQTGAPPSTPTLVSRLITPAYYLRQCALYFPPSTSSTTNSTSAFNHLNRTTSATNARTHGWNVTNSTRLLWTNGQFDPWRSAGVSSDFRPGGPLEGTQMAPVSVIAGGFHCSDLLVENAVVDGGVRAVVEREVEWVRRWVGEWPRGY